MSRTDLFDGRAITSLFDVLDTHEPSAGGVYEADDARAIAARVIDELHGKNGRN